MGEKMRLNQLATQFTQYFNLRGGFSNDVKRNHTNKLLEMTQDVDMEGRRL